METQEESHMHTVVDLFSNIENQLKNELELKDCIRAIVHRLEENSRKIETVLQGIHQASDSQQHKLCQEYHRLMSLARDDIRDLAEKLKREDFYRYHHIWQGVFTKLSCWSSLVVFLESNHLATRQVIARMLGVETDRNNGFHLELDDYLCGVLTMVSELARLALNSVTLGDYAKPLSISHFVTEIESGFRLLNLKNDHLRKKFDGLKYDVKKIEQVVYDLKIRGLLDKKG